MEKKKFTMYGSDRGILSRIQAVSVSSTKIKESHFKNWKKI